MVDRLMDAVKKRDIRKPRQGIPPESAIKTLVYEIKSLSDAYGAFLDADAKKKAAGLHSSVSVNITLEAFLLHVRILRDFFLGTTFCDDILAIDFALDSTEFELPNVMAVSTQLDKYLAHPSYTRVNATNWPVADMHTEILDAWHLFLSRVAIAQPEVRERFAIEGE
jgi:hypothetical protein